LAALFLVVGLVLLSLRASAAMLPVLDASLPAVVATATMPMPVAAADAVRPGGEAALSNAYDSVRVRYDDSSNLRVAGAGRTAVREVPDYDRGLKHTDWRTLRAEGVIYDLAATGIAAKGVGAGGGGRSVATVFLHDTGHASIMTEVGDATLHTEQVMLPGRFTTIAEVGPGGAPIINSAKIPLPNGAGAMGYQQSMLGKPTGIYNPVRNNCFGHCIKVLEAGGVEGVPTDSRQLIPWLFGGP
jgi:hypothetical protein